MEENNSTSEIKLSDFWNTLKRCWWVLLATLIVVFLVLYLVASVTHEDQYSAKTSIYILRDNGEGSGSSNFSSADITIANYILKDCEVLFRSRDHVLRPVIESQNLSGVLNAEQLDKMISITNEENTRVLYLTVTTKNAQRSVDLANAIAQKACEYYNGYYNSSLCNINDVANLDDAKTPSNPVSKMKLLLVAVAAMIVVYLAYFLLYILDDKINTAEDVEKYLGVNMLGVIPNREDARRRKSKGGYYYSHEYDGSGAVGAKTNTQAEGKR